MTTTLRRATLETLDLGTVRDIFANGTMPVSPAAAVDAVFGPADARGALVISGANGIVGSGKAMQLGARLNPYGVPVVALDLPSAPDGIGKHYGGLVRAFGRAEADSIMQSVVRMNYDGATLPEELDRYQPRFLLEAIPEVLEIKKGHYELFRGRYPEIEIRSVTSGFPGHQLGVGIAHPAFPHEINKIYEIVEDETSDVTRMLWALGLQPMRVSDDWSFVLDVLFCGLTLAGLRYHDASNMPFWKIDKQVRKLLGPNPFRAHDAIGAKGADFLTWSCLHHLAENYGEVFRPTPTLDERKETGMEWYPPNHFRPLVDWSLDADANATLRTWLFGPIFQMTTLMLHENRTHLAQMNLIGEQCAQFRSGPLALMRAAGADGVKSVVADYHALHPAAADSAWFPDTLDAIDSAEWQQLYVNAEHDGTVGVLTLGREAYNHDVDAELNRAIDWLKAAAVERVILTGDFHLAGQLVGADTSNFFPALEDTAAGFAVSNDWSRTARRLNDEFAVSVGFINGKRCLGGMLELVTHCHYLVALDDASLGFPEVTLPVVPGMEGCHWPFRRTDAAGHGKLMQMLLSGRFVRGDAAVGWLVDAAGSMTECLPLVWSLATDGEHGLSRRPLETAAVVGVPTDVAGLGAGEPALEIARKAIVDCVQGSCAAPLPEAVDVQSRHSAEFMVTDACRRGRVGAEASKTLNV
jgi:enoyl-CoA hydratase/carnithine racemase/3-hydroxyacyl-CoA dehydrogenase